MIGKPKWFTYRIFGWGLRPRTWQGWVYTAVVALLLGFITASAMNNAIKMWLFAIVLGVLLLDIMHIMIQLDKVHDERENLHQLIIERNCSFAAIAALISIMLYQTSQNKALIGTTMPFDYSIAIVLGVMVLTKAASYYYVENKI